MGIPFYFGHDSFCIKAPKSLIKATEAAVKSVLPNARFGEGREVTVCVHEQGELWVSVSLEGGKEWRSQYNIDVEDPQERDRRQKELVRLGIHHVFQDSYNLAPSPWGTLTGVRPTKIVHSLVDSGRSWQQIKQTLLEVYALSPEKATLLMDVASRQKEYFHPCPNNPVSVYIGIPFCPTRCSYCSFAAYPMTSHGHLLKGFLSALKAEIEAIGNLLGEIGLEVESVYLGGGTPTTITGTELSELLHLIRQKLFTSGTKEFTVEAGRPETLSLDTLSILKEAGVQRISINPQTMHDETLEAIGRKHTVEDVCRAFVWARQVGIPIINMDIILGLPGESLEHVERTLQEIGKLGPDNLTVHSLSLKRASQLKKSCTEVQIAHSQGQDMVSLARDYALRWGLTPYYLYRQRHILGGLENVGYAKPYTASIYNIQMMEERQTIVALGGGGMTKLVYPDGSLIRQSNPKCPATYSHVVNEGLSEKVDQIRQHLVG